MRLLFVGVLVGALARQIVRAHQQEHYYSLVWYTFMVAFSIGVRIG